MSRADLMPGPRYDEPMPPVRYDERRKVYRDCRFCAATGRKGCLACEGEAEAEYKRQFPDGPKPIATLYAQTSDGPQNLGVFDLGAIAENKGGIADVLKGLIGPDAIMAAKDEARAKLESPGTGSLLRAIAEQSLGRPLTEQDKDVLVAQMSGDVLADNIRKAGLAQALPPLPAPPEEKPKRVRKPRRQKPLAQ